MNDRSEKREWATAITRIERNVIEVSGYPLEEVVGRKGLIDVAYLLLNGAFPDERQVERLQGIARDAARLPAPAVAAPAGEETSRSIARWLLCDDRLASFPDERRDEKTAFCIGRVLRYFASLFGHERVPALLDGRGPFALVIHGMLTGRRPRDAGHAAMVEAMAVASADHGVTPPSTQTAVLAASVRASYESALAAGIGTLTRVHGGAGFHAAGLFRQAVTRSEEGGRTLAESLQDLMAPSLRDGKRIEGLGHRFHDTDPRCGILWALSERWGIARGCVACSRIVSDVACRRCGRPLPVNVDGAIGAVVADMNLPAPLARAVFILGRVAGLSAHYFEEISSFRVMRWIDFSMAVYQGPATRHIP